MLDTHALIWFLAGDPQLPNWSSALIEDVSNPCFVSMVSPWEMTIKVALRKLRLPYRCGQDLRRLLDRNEIDVLALEPGDFDALSDLPRLHGDPFDRMIAAQAIRHQLTLISGDEVFDRYGLRRQWES